MLVLLLVSGTIVSLSMGMRQSMGLFMGPLTTDLGISAATFSFSLALQNIVWGLSQPVVGALADRYGARPVVFATTLIYAAGLGLMIVSRAAAGLDIAGFLCGIQLVFITTHLPQYLQVCGVSPEVGAQALGLIGFFNTIGTYLFGHLGARYSPKKLLALIYGTRTVFICIFLAVPITATTTLIFAAAMRFLWLGVAPLVTGVIGRVFGLGHFNALYGTVFLSHQVGSFAGAWMGGVVFSATGSYSMAWAALIAIGAIAFLLQWTMDDRPADATAFRSAAHP